MSGPLSVLRESVAAALASIPAVASGDWVVLSTPFDAVTPPCFLVQQGPDPGGTRRTFCAYDTQLEVLAIAARLEPQANYPVLEDMLEAAVAALETAQLPAYQWLAPAPLEVAQVTYLAIRLQLRQPVTIGVP